MVRELTTLYLRGMPTRIVRGAKAAAAQQGTTLTSLIAQALERTLQAGGASGDPVENDFALDMEWYAKNRARLVRQYDGEYVAILDARVADHDRDFEALAARVFKRAGVRSVFMPRVRARERPVRVRSPRHASA
jgi:hypothetical protein